MMDVCEKYVVAVVNITISTHKLILTIFCVINL